MTNDLLSLLVSLNNNKKRTHELPLVSFKSSPHLKDGMKLTMASKNHNNNKQTKKQKKKKKKNNNNNNYSKKKRPKGNSALLDVKALLRICCTFL